MSYRSCTPTVTLIDTRAPSCRQQQCPALDGGDITTGGAPPHGDAAEVQKLLLNIALGPECFHGAEAQAPHSRALTQGGQAR